MFKTKQIQRFLQEGDKVKVTVRYRGRELAHPELGRTVLTKVTEDLEPVATIEKPAQMEGRAMTMIVAPGKALQKHPAGPQAPRAAAPANGAAPAPAATHEPVAQREPVRAPQPVS